MRLIESDDFQFEFLSEVGHRESWRKEVHRPIYHVHKWWAKRLGSVFRGVLLGSVLPSGSDIRAQFYRHHDFKDLVVLDPFLGSGTTVGEAHKLGFTALGRDINPVAVNAVRAALSLADSDRLKRAFAEVESGVGQRLRELYSTSASDGSPAEVLYFFWVMHVPCASCNQSVDLFPSYAFARNAYPSRKPEVQALCPTCGDVFRAAKLSDSMKCTRGHEFSVSGPARGSTATCPGCSAVFSIKKAVAGRRPAFRMYAKMVLRSDGVKEYLATSEVDRQNYEHISRQLISSGSVLPTLELSDGNNTRQAMDYGFRRWSDFFNDRQLLGLLALRKEIAEVSDPGAREALQILFSGTLEFNNMFASFKGEGTGAVRHMFSHHILKPERTPIEANIWGTSRSSGSFAGLFKSRLLRASDYLQAPTEISSAREGKPLVASKPFSRELAEWRLPLPARSVALSCGDSARTDLPEASVDLVITDPPFFDNVHYSELADFFQAWSCAESGSGGSTRRAQEVQDKDGQRFAQKLGGVFAEVSRVLKDDGLLVFSYHHSRDEGWTAVAEALLTAGFVVVNAHPVRAEMMTATPKAQAKEPIQLDMLIVCRKGSAISDAISTEEARERASAKLKRLELAGYQTSSGDRRVVEMGHLLMTVRTASDVREFGIQRTLFRTA